MRQAKLCVVLLTLALSWHGLPEQGFAWDHTQSTNFGVLQPGDHVQFKVTPPQNAQGKDAIVTKGFYDTADPGGSLWWGSLASWHSTITPEYPSSHSGHFHGEYGYPGTGGVVRALTWEAKTELLVPKVDVDITGVSDKDEETVGAWLAKGGSRKRVSISRVYPRGNNDQQTLRWKGYTISLWTQASDGDRLPGDSKQLPTDSPANYYVQGDWASDSVRGEYIEIEYRDGDFVIRDRVNLTVVGASLSEVGFIARDQTNNVTITPRPSPAGTNITLQISCLEGSGSAVFIPSGTTTTNITQSTTIKIKGVTPSSVVSNMMLKAMFGSDLLASNKFTVVGLQSPLQYKIGTNVWANIPDPLYVGKDTTADFKAIKMPTNAPWPSGKPVWGGVASGVGEIKSVTFSTTGTNFVTAECGNTVTGKVIVLKVDIEQAETNVCWTMTSVTLNLTSDSYLDGGTANWNSMPSGISGSGTNITFNPVSLTPTTYVVQAWSSLATNCFDTCTVTVLKVDITPLAMNATESLDSGTFTCTVTPSGLNPTYQWLTGSANDAWPATAGNNPELDYSAATASETIIGGTRWFAPTPSRRQVVDGVTCDYSVNCEVTVGGVKCRASTPATLSVTVNMTGQTVLPVFQNWDTITVAETGGIWQVTGQGNFSRSAPDASVNMPTTSQFYDKAMVHENKHVEQWTTGMFKDLKDANALYNSTLSTLTSTNSEADLIDKIDAAVWAQIDADNAVYDSKTCDAEKEAFDAMNAEDPDFLELDDADWKPLYGCQ